MAEKGKLGKGKNAKNKEDMVEGGESSGESFQKKIGISIPKEKEHVSTKVFKSVGKCFSGLVKSDKGKPKINLGEGNQGTWMTSYQYQQHMLILILFPAG